MLYNIHVWQSNGLAKQWPIKKPRQWIFRYNYQAFGPSHHLQASGTATRTVVVWLKFGMAFLNLFFWFCIYSGLLLVCNDQKFPEMRFTSPVSIFPSDHWPYRKWPFSENDGHFESGSSLVKCRWRFQIWFFRF